MRGSVVGPDGAGKPGRGDIFAVAPSEGIHDVKSLPLLFTSRPCAVPSAFSRSSRLHHHAAAFRQALTTNNIDMSSTESSGPAPAEATATTPASTQAATPSFGSTRGSGLARGKRPGSNAPSAKATPVNTDYKPTAIEIVTAPREYQNPFAPATPEPAPQVEASVASAPVAEPVAAPAPVAAAPVETSAPAASVPVAQDLFPLDTPAAPATAQPAPAAVDEKAELNILPPERQKTTPAQTWESEGFRPAREPRGDRPRRDERFGGERREDAVPSKFRYERPKDGSAPSPAPAPRDNPSPYIKPTAVAPTKSGGFFGWLKSLFGGSSAPAKPASGSSSSGESRQGGDRDGSQHQRRHRGGRGRGGYQGGQGGQGGGSGDQQRSPGGEQPQGGEGQGGGEYRGEGRGDRQGEGFRRRRRGGRNRGQFRGDRREGGGGGEGGGAPQGN